ITVTDQGQVVDGRAGDRSRIVIVGVVIGFDTSVTIIRADTIPVFTGTVPAFGPVEQVITYVAGDIVYDQVFGIDRTAEPLKTVVGTFINLYVLDHGTIAHTE